MSKMRLAAACLLVLPMFWNRQVGQARMQEMRGNGKDDSLPEYGLTQTPPFWLAFCQNWISKPAGTARNGDAGLSVG